ncbi:MAG: 50S ribosomal protein L25 [Pyrinomonadaceae bacterium]
MANKITVKAEKREQSGKGFARRLRQAGKVPINIYGGGGESVSAAVELKDLAAILRSDSGHNTVFSLDIAGVGANDVMFQDRQIDPLKGRLLHADLRRLKKGEKIEVTVPLHLIGEPIGVRENDGVLQQQMREIKILCEPANIPDSFEIDVEHLNLNESVHVSDLKIGQGIEIHEDPEAVVASVTLVKEEVVEPQIAEEGAEPEIVGQEENAEGTEENEDKGK